MALISITIISISLLLGIIIGLIVSINRYPISEVKRVYRTFLDEGYKDGELKHMREKVDHNFKTVVKPNCEILYSSTFIKPADRSYIIRIPINDDYFGVTFLDVNTDVLAYITNEDLSTTMTTEIVLKHSDENGNRRHDMNNSGKEQNKTIYLESALCWIIIRFGIDSDDNLEAVHKKQDEILLKALAN